MHTITQLQARALTPTETTQRTGSRSKGGSKKRRHIECKFKLHDDDDTEMAEIQTENTDQDMQQRIDHLFEQLKQLTQQRDYYKRGMHIYKEAMLCYKRKYLQMLSIINPMQQNEQMHEHDPMDSNNVLPLPSITPPNFANGATETTEQTHNNNDHDTDTEMEMENDGHETANSHSNTSIQNELNVDENADSADSIQNTESDEDAHAESITNHTDDFENSYRVSATCHYKDCRQLQHFDTYQSYSKHLQTHYSKPFTCDLGCDAKPQCMGNLIAHISMHTGGKPFLCNICTHSTTTKGCMKKHWKIMHTVNGKVDNTKRKRKQKVTKCENEYDAESMHSEVSQPTDMHVRKNRLQDSPPVILCSRLTANQMMDYERFKQKYEHIVSFTSKWNENVTHLVTQATLVDDAMLRERTMKYFQSAVAGCWVLCFDWIEQCLKENRWIDESKHELMGDTQGACGCKISRISRMNKSDTGLFANVIVFIASEFQHTVKLNRDLQSLFRMGGAKIRNKSEMNKCKREMTDGNGRKLVFVYDDTNESDMTQKQLKFCNKYDVLPMGLQQVFDTISAYKSI
eukprot:215552_1